jgi:hypothetical protein
MNSTGGTQSRSARRNLEASFFDVPQRAAAAHQGAIASPLERGVLDHPGDQIGKR